MAFWSSQTLEEKGAQLIDPFRKDRIQHGAYELSVGAEAYIPSDGKKSKVEPGSPITIPPGQFGLLITREVVTVPKNAIAFISIRAGTKFRGLVNVSGFHVDPGYNDRLMFSVYNAGSQNIVLDYDQAVFLIWYADLDGPTKDPYPERTGEPRGISADDMMKIQGEVASPAELKKQLDDLKHQVENQAVELKSEIDTKFRTTEQSWLINRWLLTVLVTALISIGATLFIKALFDSSKSTQPVEKKNGPGKDL
jgi:dCTP deaminase